MKDSAILGSGNSRYLKSVADFKTLYPTYDDFAAALVAGTLPIDLNGINSAGFQQVGDALGKATLLKDTTAAMYGLGDTAVPDDVLLFLSKAALLDENGNVTNFSGDIVNGFEFGTYTGTGRSGQSYPNSLTFGFKPHAVFITANSYNSSSEGTVLCSSVFIYGAPAAFAFNANSSGEAIGMLNLSWVGNTLSWYLDGAGWASPDRWQLNLSGQTYSYIAI